MQNLQTHSGPHKKYGANILKHLLRDCNSSWCMIQIYLNSIQMNVQLNLKIIKLVWRAKPFTILKSTINLVQIKVLFFFWLICRPKCLGYNLLPLYNRLSSASQSESLRSLFAGSVKRNVLIAGNAGHVGFSFLCKLHEAVLITRSPAYPRDKTF